MLKALILEEVVLDVIRSLQFKKFSMKENNSCNDIHLSTRYDNNISKEIDFSKDNNSNKSVLNTYRSV